MNHLEKILTDAKLKKDLKFVLNLAIHDFELNQCFWSYTNLMEMQKTLSPEAKKIFEEEFSGIFIKLKWVALPRFRENELLELLEKHLLIIKELSLEVFHLVEKIREYLLGIINYEDRDTLKFKIREALLRNQEILDNNSPVKTIGDWLRNITAEVGQGVANNLKENEYYLRNKNFIKLNKEDQEFLKSVIVAYKYCWYSSQTPEGLDEPINIIDENGQLKVIEHGLIMDVPPLDKETEKIVDEFIGVEEKTAGSPSKKATLAPVKEDLLKKYHQVVGQLFSRQKVKDYLSNFQKANASEIIQKLENAVIKKEQDLILATLASLITKGQFAFIEQSSIYKEWQAGFLKSHLGIEVINLTNKEQKEILLGQFVKSILEKAAFEAQTGAMAALHLFNLLKEQGQKNYLNMVFADLKSQAFRWREVEIKNGRLALK